MSEEAEEGRCTSLTGSLRSGTTHAYALATLVLKSVAFNQCAICNRLIFTSILTIERHGLSLFLHMTRRVWRCMFLQYILLSVIRVHSTQQPPQLCVLACAAASDTRRKRD